MNVTFTDWTILTVLFLVFLVMAICLNRLCRSVADYLVSGRKVRMWLGMGSGIAGEVGLVSIAGMCEQGYTRGYGFILIALLSMCVTVPLFGVLGFGIERFRASMAMSVPQYVEMRYSRGLRMLTGILNSAAGVLQMCLFPIVGAGFLRVLMQAPEFVQVAGVRLQTAWLIMAVLLSCNVIFTFLGGSITLVVTNFFHMIITMGVLYWTCFLVVGRIGLQQLWTGLEIHKGAGGVNPFAGDSTAYGLTWFCWLMAMTILLQFSYGPYLQKIASMDRPKTVSRAYLLGSLFGNGRTFVVMGLGVAALAALGPAVPAGVTATGDLWSRMATPYFLAQMVPPVLMGFLLAGLLFADTSTTDQYILSWATSIVNDCICPFRKDSFTPRQHIVVVKITIVVLCVLFFLFGLTYTPTLPIWEYLWLLANIIGGTGIAVLCGMYWKRAKTGGAYAAVLTCVILPVADLVARRVYVARGLEFPLRPEVTGLYTYVIGFALLVVISLCTPGEGKYWDLGETVREMNREAE